MSMAINRISASGVAAMLYPVIKTNRVAKVDSGSRTTVVAAATSSQAVQSVSGSQSDTSNTAEQVRAAFQYALAALSSVATTDTTAQSSPEAQAGGVQAGGAYAQVGQPLGQTLDLTA